MAYNLLPKELYPAKPNYKKIVFVAANVFFLGIMSFNYFSYVQEAKAEIGKTEELQKQVVGLRTNIDQLKNKLLSDPDYQRLKSPVNQWVLVPPLRVTSFQYGDFLLLLSEITPPGIVITAVNSNTEAVHVVGQAKTYEALNQFYQRLKDLKVFYGLRFYELKDFLDKKIITFDIGGLLNPQSEKREGEKNGVNNGQASTNQANTGN